MTIDRTDSFNKKTDLRVGLNGADKTVSFPRSYFLTGRSPGFPESGSLPIRLLADSDAIGQSFHAVTTVRITVAGQLPIYTGFPILPEMLGTPVIRFQYRNSQEDCQDKTGRLPVF